MLYLMTGFKMKVCLREKKSEITSWVTCGLSPLLVYTVVKRSFFYTSSLTELIVLVSISVSNKQNISVRCNVSGIKRLQLSLKPSISLLYSDYQ